MLRALVVRSIKKLLVKKGYEVVVCCSGEEAMAIIGKQSVDLIVCDVRMPKMNGVETVRRIREQLFADKKKPVREILITGYVEDSVKEEAEALQVADYIYKPFDAQDFMDCISKNLKNMG